VRKIQRLAAVGAMAALTVALAACGSSQTASTGTATSAPAAAPTAAATSAAAASDGVTTNADVFGPACNMLPTGDAPGSLNNMGPQPVASAASTNPLLTTLVTAVKAANLVDTLNSQKAITVYAPYNGAFDAVQKALGAEKFGALLKDPTALGGLLSYHVVPQRYDAAGLVAAGKTTELAGGDVTVGGTATAPTLTDGQGNTATVLCGNIPTSNATVFVIDKVLMPKA
jgi:uncharacterized surface protein with fasciclin (FAS1) repeats